MFLNKIIFSLNFVFIFCFLKMQIEAKQKTKKTFSHSVCMSAGDEESQELIDLFYNRERKSIK